MIHSSSACNLRYFTTYLPKVITVIYIQQTDQIGTVTHGETQLTILLEHSLLSPSSILSVERRLWNTRPRGQSLHFDLHTYLLSQKSKPCTLKSWGRRVSTTYSVDNQDVTKRTRFPKQTSASLDTRPSSSKAKCSKEGAKCLVCLVHSGLSSRRWCWP